MAANAVLSKARVMYGNMLTQKDYEGLLACCSVGDVVAYLKAHTRYKTALEKVNENDVHRGRLEVILKQELFRESEALCRYEISVGDRFHKYFLQKTEIEEINHFIMLLSAGKPEEYIYSLPLFFDDRTKLNLQLLPKVKTYEELLAAVENTEYYETLKKFQPEKGKPLDKAGIECALYNILYKNIFEIIDKKTRGSQKEQLYKYFQTFIDFSNLDRIIRMKKYFKLSPEDIKSKLLSYGSLSSKSIDAMCSAQSGKEVFSVIKDTPLGIKIGSIDYVYSGEISARIRYKKCKKFMHFSTHPFVVMLSYIYLASIEAKNITTIIEGVRYNVSPDTIKSILIV